MSTIRTDRRRVGFSLLVAFGVSWFAAFVSYATGVLADSQRLSPPRSVFCEWDPSVLLVLFLFGRPDVRRSEAA